jgi:hypothetical protein
MFMALGALVVVAVLIAGSTFITTQEARLGQNQLVQARAMAAAEYGLNKIQADWDKTPNLDMDNGATFDTSYTLLNQGTARVRYVRLNNETFYILAEGRATVGNSVAAARTAVKRVGAILRLRIPTIKTEGAVTTAGNVDASGNAHILGNDSTPPGWEKCTSNTDKAALVVGTTATVSYPSGSNVNNVAGTPTTTKSSFATDSNTYVRFGDETWYQLLAGANHTMSSLVGGTPTTNAADNSCKKTDSGNWGEPKRTSSPVTACYNYFPIIYVSTTTSVTGGRGQGILLINGDFTFGGGFEWYGLVIVKDDIKKGTGTSTIHGGIMARNAVTSGTTSENTEDLGGTTNLLYSGCSLERAMRGSAQVLQAKHRAWTELF